MPPEPTGSRSRYRPAMSMRLTAMIQDGELQLMSDADTIAMTPTYRVRPAG